MTEFLEVLTRFNQKCMLIVPWAEEWGLSKHFIAICDERLGGRASDSYLKQQQKFSDPCVLSEASLWLKYGASITLQ